MTILHIDPLGSGAPSSTASGSIAWRRALGLGPGLVLTSAITAVAILLAAVPWLQTHGGSALTLALLGGVVVGNTVYGRAAARCTDGVNFSKQRLLRLGIVLYGLRLTFGDIGRVGLEGIAIDAVMVGSTFLLGTLAGVRLLGLDRRTAMLIGAGSAICGAAAVMATAPVLRARAEETAVAIATVVVFGTFAVFLYPALYAWNLEHHWVALSASAFGSSSDRPCTKSRRSWRPRVRWVPRPRIPR